MRRQWGLCLLALLVFSTGVSAQTAATAVVTGTVTDQSGAVVPGAEVELYDLGTNSTRKVNTDQNGVYRFVNVIPTTYRITATAQGFKKAVFPSIKIDVAKSYNVPITLEVGDVASTIEVQAATSAEIQTMDATVGNAVGGTELLRLPTNNRSAASLLMLQPLVTPGRGVGSGQSGQVAGARSDQSTFLLDGGDSTNNTEGSGGYNTGFDGVILPMIPVPVESIEEFRVGTTNPNATFGRSQGGQISMVTKRGTNNLHGSVYWYHQNDNLNAMGWDRNRRNEVLVATGRSPLRKPELKDNRYGFTLGGPILKDRLFMFGHYEGRRWPRTNDVIRTVPLSDLRNGILNFRDASGVVRSYNLATSTACGPAGGVACDPRGLGISPVIQSIYNLLPQQNTGSGGDGLNTRDYSATVDNTIKEEFFVVRTDYKLTDKWDLFASFRYAHTDESGIQQVDISGITGCNAPCSTRVNPLEPRYFVFGVNGQFSPTLLSETRFSWYRHWWEWGTRAPFPQVAGTAAAIQLAGEGANKTIADPMNIDTQNARSRIWNGKDTFVAQNMTWLKGKHTIQFGGSFRHEDIFHQRTDQVTGGLSGGPIFWARSVTGGGGSFLNLTADNRPPTCTTMRTTNCIDSGDIPRWEAMYAATLGLIDQSGQMLSRDGQFNPLPLGTGLEAQVLILAFEGYAQDVWRVTPNFTLTYGLTYQVQRPPTEELGRQVIPVYAASNKPIVLSRYFALRRLAAESGTIYNPDIAFSPIKAIPGQKYITEVDWNNVGPRVSAAWQPKIDNWLFGNGKTAIRGGWAVTYTRMNGVGLVMTPILGAGLGEILRCTGPQNAVFGTGGCSSSTNALTGFRVGPDGDGSTILPSTVTPAPAQIPFPVTGTVTGPASNRVPFGASRNFAIDPGLELGYSHSFDVTWQRELPGDLLLEVGYVGRIAKNLIQNVDFASFPFFQVDPISGQTAIEAFDAVAAEIRAGVLPSAVTPQPFFENAINGLIPNYTRFIAGSRTNDFRFGNLASLFANRIDRDRLSNNLEPFNNMQVGLNNYTSDGGWSNYNALFFTFRKRTAGGLAWDFNYTLAKSTDTFGLNQENTAFSWASPFYRKFDVQPSQFDVRHVFNGHWYYELPFGRGKRFATDNNIVEKVIGGWHISGLFVASSGLPLCVATGGFNLGAPNGNSCAVSTQGSIKQNSVHKNIAGSNGIGTNGNPAAPTFGTGLSLFSDPEAVFNAFRVPSVSDTVHGRGQLRGLPHWNVDFSLGKKTQVTEQIGVVFTFDMLNVFNHAEFNNPSVSLTDRPNFGVLTSQWGGTLTGPRRIQFGLRVEF